MTPPRAGQGAALVAFPGGWMQRRGQRVGAATLDCNSAMTRGCEENRAKCGSLEGAALLAQAAEQASMSPGKDEEGSAHTQDSWPRRVLKSHTPKLCEPSGASSHGGAYAETTGTQTPPGSVCQGLHHHRLEALGTVRGLSWRQLCFGAVCGTAQGYQCCPWVSQSLPGLSSLPRGTGLGILCWGHPMAALHLSLHHSVLSAHSSPLLNSHTSASSLLSNHLHHQTPLTPQQQSHLWPCQLLLPLAKRQRTWGRRNEGWEERGKEPGKSFTPRGILPPPRAG